MNINVININKIKEKMPKGCIKGVLSRLVDVSEVRKGSLQKTFPST